MFTLSTAVHDHYNLAGCSLSNLLTQACLLSCLSTEKQSSYFCGQLAFPCWTECKWWCVIDIANQGWSGLDQYEVKESLFNQDLTCSLLGEQWSVKWHNSLKADTHAHTHIDRKDRWDLLCASPLCTLCYNYLTQEVTLAHTQRWSLQVMSVHVGIFNFYTSLFNSFT